VLALNANERTFDERVDTAVAEALGQHGYIDEQTGEFDRDRLCDALEPPIAGAVATKKSDRAKVCVMRYSLVADHAFPKVTGPEAWADHADPPFAEELYKRLDGLCWRQTQMGPGGPLQERFNSDQGLVLCRTKVNPGKTDAVYVTRDVGCITEDLTKPMNAAQKKRADREAALVAMLIERVPEHGKRFHRDLVSGLRTALTSAETITAAALEAASFADDESDEDIVDDE
jgi:hypothetical protein